MKILVFGAGVIGSYYATKLYQGKIDVTLLARGEKFKNIKEKGVLVEDFFSGKQTVSKVRVIDKPDNEAYDLIMVIVQMNQIDNLGHDKILAGFGAVGGTRKDHKVIYTDKDSEKPNKITPLVLGKVNAFSDEKFKKIIALFESANITVEPVEDMDGWLKTHAAMIMGLVSATYKKDYNIKAIADDKELIKLIVKALRESMAALKTLGVTIVPKRNRYLHLFPGFLLEFIFKKMLRSEYAEIAIAGHAKAARLEMRNLADGLLLLCKKSKVKHGSLEKLTRCI